MKYKITISILFLFFLFSCNNEDNIIENRTIQKKKELLIHCGIAMVKPMTEIAKTIEKQENCIIKITTGGSRNLYKSIEANKIGDLYLPGSEKYIENGMIENFITKKNICWAKQSYNYS